jgi:hypothetical protein
MQYQNNYNMLGIWMRRLNQARLNFLHRRDFEKYQKFIDSNQLLKKMQFKIKSDQILTTAAQKLYFIFWKVRVIF